MEIHNFSIEDKFVSLRVTYLGKQQEIKCSANKLLEDTENKLKIANCLKSSNYFKQETTETVKLLFPAIKVSSTNPEESETILRKINCTKHPKSEEYLAKISKTVEEKAQECTNKQEIAYNCLVLKFNVADLTDLPFKKTEKVFDWTKIAWELTLLLIFAFSVLALNPYTSHPFRGFAEEDLLVLDNQLFSTIDYKYFELQLEGTVKVTAEGVFAARNNVLRVYPWNASEYEIKTTSNIIDYFVGETTVILDRHNVLYLVYDRSIKYAYPIGLEINFNKIALQGSLLTVFSKENKASVVFLLGINGIQVFGMESYRNEIQRVVISGGECYISSEERTSKYKLVNGQVVLSVISEVESMFCGKIKEKLLLVENNYLVTYSGTNKEIISRVANVKDCKVSGNEDILIKDEKGVRIKRRDSDYIEALE